MSEAETPKQRQEVETSEAAKWSLGLALISVLSIVSLVIVPNCVSVLALLISTVLATILGVVAIRQIKRSNGRVKGTALAVTGITFHLVLAAVVTYGLFAVRSASFRVFCRTQLSSLGKALSSYAESHNAKYPSACDWCDLLIQSELAGDIQFFCKEAMVRGDIQRCNYAMNPECEPDSPGDVVLLFETKAGWNQAGGPEILTTENHEDEGCWVTCNDTSVRFVRTGELGRLKWKVEETSSVE
ncbi:MAG TPA: DUF4190 domain-containing protein [Sedimentisphaerales bacterium]|nr:DUF4190 domain-containing protein [Sedimentisphaerales bacterium]